MSRIGKIESLWRYPVKSMRDEQMTEIFMGFSGVYGDRCFAFKNSASRKGFPYLSDRAAKHVALPTAIPGCGKSGKTAESGRSGETITWRYPCQCGSGRSVIGCSYAIRRWQISYAKECAEKTILR